MPQFSVVSQNALATAHPDLQRLFNEVIKHKDCMVLIGHRDQAAQDAAVAAGNSKTPWPTSKHNSIPSLAVDVVPVPLNWNDKSAFDYFGGFVLGVAGMLGISIRWGGDFGMNDNLHDDKFVDMPHFELRGY